MKLYEIENYLEKKVRRKNWKKGLIYIYFKNGGWVNRDGYFFMGDSAEEDNWEEYTEPEPPKVKRYWLWIMSSQFAHDKGKYVSSIYKTGQYVNEKGNVSTGESYIDDWDKRTKIKMENEWVEINQNGELVNWAGKE